jgi:uncharacterized membrane protein
MRLRLLTLTVLTAATLWACADAGAPTAPASALAPSGPARAVVNFGYTQVGASNDGAQGIAVNDAGQVAFDEAVASDNRAALWENGSTQLLDNGPSGSPTQALDVNALGTVVGLAQGPNTAPIVWEGGVFTTLALYPGSTSTIARAINDAGQIVGSDAGGLFWSDKTAAPVRLQTLGFGSSPRDINNAGVIVGASVPGGAFQRAVVWTSATAAPQALAGLGTAYCESKVATATAINEMGEIVGSCPDAGGGLHAVYWANKDATPVDLDLLADGSSAAGINELGQIIGLGGFPSHAMLWSREGGVFRRLDLGAPGGLDASQGDALNNTGQAVVNANDQALSVLGLYLVSIPMRATIDVDPSSTANTIKLDRKGSVTVAILGSRWFRATDVDPASLTLGNDDGLDTPISMKKGVPVAKLTDVNRDGFVDVVADFDEGALMNNGDLALGGQTLVLLGRTKTGVHVRGTDVALASK